MGKKEIITISVIVVIVLILIVMFSPLRTLIPQATIQRGFTINSITAPPIFENSDLSNLNFIVSVTFDAGADRIIGDITPSEFKAFSGVETSFPLIIEATAIDEILDYQIINEKIPIFEFDWNIQDSGDCPSSAIKQIKVPFLTFPFNSNTLCFFKNQKGVKGELQNPSIKEEVDIKLTVGNDVIERTISNQNTFASFTSGGQTRATVQATGILLTGEPVPDQSRFVVIFDRDAGEWILADDDLYNPDYTNALPLKENEILSEPSSYSGSLFLDRGYNVGLVLDEDEAVSFSSQEAERLVNFPELNSLLNSNAKLSTSGFDQYIRSKDKSASNSLVRIRLDRRTGNLQAVFKVQASWVGVQTLISKPRIISSTCGNPQGDDCKSGGQCQIKTTIQNVGDGEGTFEVTVSDCSPFQALGGSARATLDANEQITLTIPLSTAEIAEAQKTCKINVISLGSNNFDTDVVSCTLEKPITCEEGKQLITGNICISQCTNGEFTEIFCCERKPQGIAGTFPTEFECKDDVEVEEEKPLSVIADSCKEQGGTLATREKKVGALSIVGIGTTETETFCKLPSTFGFDLDISGNQLVISILISLLLGFVTFLILFKLLGKDKTIIIISSVIAILVTILSGFLLINFFAEIIIGTIIILVVLFVVWIAIQVIGKKILFIG